MKSIVFVYITNPSKDEAKRVAKHLLGKQLIGCANIFKVAAMYPREGTLADENESVLIAKTTEDNFDRVKQEVEEIHPFTIPCIVKIPVRPTKSLLSGLVTQ